MDTDHPIPKLERNNRGKIIVSVVLVLLFFCTSTNTRSITRVEGGSPSRPLERTRTQYVHHVDRLSPFGSFEGIRSQNINRFDELLSSSDPFDRFGTRNVGGFNVPENADVRHYGTTADDKIIYQARQWIRECLSHAACRPPSGDPFTPTRLVYVGQDERWPDELSRPRIVERPDLPGSHSGPYLALSHCWGGDVKSKLTRESYDAMRRGIDVKRLPQNFRDAIRLTRTLGYQYIWIDSLCIIQDDESDWSRESVLMIKVYAHAHCTISATASRTSHGGCIRGRWIRAEEPFMSLSDWQQGRSPDTLSTLFDTRVESAPLTRRAWAFQERLLSRRMLHFCADMVLFECNTLQASEVNTVGAAYEKTPYVLVNGTFRLEPKMSRYTPETGSHRRDAYGVRWDFMRGWQRVDQPRSRGFASDGRHIKVEEIEDHTPTKGIRGALDTLTSVVIDDNMTLWQKLEFNRRWYELVSYYSQGNLTRQSDKLIAIAGVARMVEESASAVYAAGLWTNVALEFGLLWQAVEPGWNGYAYVMWLCSTVWEYTFGNRKVPYSTPSWSWFWERQFWDFRPSWSWSFGKKGYSYCAPSWSWASVNARIAVMPEVSSTAQVSFHSRVNQAVVKLDGQIVEKAASHLDDGYIDIVGPVAPVINARRNKITLQLLGGQKQVTIQYAPDPGRSGRTDGMTALLIMSMDSAYLDSGSFAYGLVLRPRTGSNSTGGFERVGIFKAPSMQPFIATEYWIEKRLRVF